MYHFRALRHGRGLWAPFRRSVAGWLSEHLPVAPELILVGPSAGHCLPLEQLARYDRLLALELDPLARRLLAARLGARRVRFEREDLLLAPLLERKPGLEQLLGSLPGVPVLFCNALGQLHFGLSGEEEQTFQAEFRRRILPALAGRAWASFHDRWSLDAAGPAHAELRFERAPPDQELGRAWFGERGPPVTVLDHGTQELFPAELERRYFGWRITPLALHVVEAVAAPAGGAGR